MSQDHQPHEHHHLFQEIWILSLFVFAAFLFIATTIPSATGVFGKLFIDHFFRNLVGRGVILIPFFFLLKAYFLIQNTNPIRNKISNIGLALCIVSVSMIFELTHSTTASFRVFALSKEGGGLIGHLALYVTQTILGTSGTIMFLFTTCISSLILMFNFSFKIKYADLKNSVNQPFPIYTFFRKIILSLFFKKRTTLSDLPEFPDDPLLALPPAIHYAPESLPAPLHPEIRYLVEDTQPDPTPKSKNRKELALLNSGPNTASETADLLPNTDYQYPDLALLKPAPAPSESQHLSDDQNSSRAKTLIATLNSFGVETELIHITKGPSVTRFELKPGPGVKIARITALSRDIALNLAVVDVRIEAPIPGKSLIGIEVPNQRIDMVTLRAIIEKTDFYRHPSKLCTALGLTITGEAILMDLTQMPHLLIAGTTGSGKSVCINTIIMSILLRATPEEVRFLMIDPKKVELYLYEGIPHLLAPVVTDASKAAATLKIWALKEMERRYEEFVKSGVKDIKGYNKKIEELIQEAEQEKALLNQPDNFTNPEGEEAPIYIPQKLPYIVVIIDELADLMMVASNDVDTTICRLAQMARATGIHLIVATQRPSVNVITGMIKSNIPSRISFALKSHIDSRTILDTQGAEKLLGKGDMLYHPQGQMSPKRVQGVYLSEEEIKRVVEFLKCNGTPTYLNEILEIKTELLDSDSTAGTNNESVDELFEEAKAIILNTQHASTSYLQRRLRIGYNRAARIMEELEAQGFVEQQTGGKRPRAMMPE